MPHSSRHVVYTCSAWKFILTLLLIYIFVKQIKWKGNTSVMFDNDLLKQHVFWAILHLMSEFKRFKYGHQNQFCFSKWYFLISTSGYNPCFEKWFETHWNKFMPTSTSSIDQNVNHTGSCTRECLVVFCWLQVWKKLPLNWMIPILIEFLY